VYQAVLDNTILPEVNRFDTKTGGTTRAPVFTFDRSVPLCRTSVDRPPMGCMVDESVIQYFERVGPPRRPLMFPALTAGVRAELAQTLRQRNATSQLLMASGLSGVSLVPPEGAADARTQQGRPAGIVGFSLPAYSSDGQALVYAHYMCGRCGHGWLFLLQESGGSWAVAAVEDLWIS
jgi:hypothetical protein